MKHLSAFINAVGIPQCCQEKIKPSLGEDQFPGFREKLLHHLLLSGSRQNASIPKQYGKGKC